jgi:hypothetical protein
LDNLTQRNAFISSTVGMDTGRVAGCEAGCDVGCVAGCVTAGRVARTGRVVTGALSLSAATVVITPPTTDAATNHKTIAFRVMVRPQRPHYTKTIRAIRVIRGQKVTSICFGQIYMPSFPWRVARE